MGRQSSESKAAAIYRVAEGKWPEAPEYLSDAAKAIWKGIVEARPPDFFRPGSLMLLEQFAEMAAAQRHALERLGKVAPTKNRLAFREAYQTCKEIGTFLNMTALKLRITVQMEVEIEDRKLEETAVRKKNPLFGGEAFRVIS